MQLSSNRIILTDVDGVLLEWENHFTQWMLKRSHFDRNRNRVQTYNLLPNKESEYAMEKRFGIEVWQIEAEIREFNRSAWMGTQPPMPNSVQWIKLLAAEGWTFIPITSQTSDLPAQELRKRRLGELFGKHIFQNYLILETGANKKETLKEFKDTGLYWVEDKWQNAIDGLDVGLKPLLIDHSYNRKFKKRGIKRVKNWKQIRQLLVK